MRGAARAPARHRSTGLIVPADALPAPVREGVDRLLRRRDAGPVVAAEPVSGGCINHGVRVSDGSRSWFAKWNRSAPAGLFEAEAAGLAALRAASSLRIPAVVGVSEGGPVPWILMEDVPPGRPAADWDERAGRGLALLHRDGGRVDGQVGARVDGQVGARVDGQVGAHAGAQARARADATPGWSEDNWIGTLPQANGPVEPWSAFWRDRRLAPQLEAARRGGHLAAADVLDRVVDEVPALLGPVDDRPAALLHGDLWSGNAYADESGAPVLVDPAVYRGHGEVDVAMTELFGGFGRAFYDAYAEVLPLDEGYRTVRRPLYQLYYLLVHVNLFGAGYVDRTLAAARATLEGRG